MTRSRDLSNDQANVGGAVAPFVAGKNKIINGDFNWFQRGTSTTVTSSSGNVFNSYLAPDRWATTYTGGTGSTFTISQQAQTPSAISGYESPYFLRYAVTNAGTYTYRDLSQRMENVQTLAGQTVTLSLWAKASASTTITPNFYQAFGTGGSADVSSASFATWNVTTSWQRFTATGVIPSISGKTVGANSWVALVLSLPATTFQIDIWGVQVEAGSVATPFTTASGTLQGELAACQRYYIRYGNTQAYSTYGVGFGNNTTQTYTPIQIRSMRVAPTSIDYSGIQVTDIGSSQTVNTLVIETNNNSDGNVLLTATVTSGLTAYRPYILRNNNSSSSYIGLSAEL